MRCPFCGCENTHVRDSRSAESGGAIRRRRFCPHCEGRFTTFERVQLRDIMVLKEDGRREPLDRTKVLRSMEIALRKRNISAETIEQAVNNIIGQLERVGDTDVSAHHIGEQVMNMLQTIDKVAYLRYASVYRNFREVEDFELFIDQEVRVDDT